MYRCMLTQIVLRFLDLFSQKIQGSVTTYLYEHPLSLADQDYKTIDIIS